MSHLSNYPPGHPFGVTRGESVGKIWYCEDCNRIGEAAELVGGNCPGCKQPVAIAECENCGQPATHIDYDQSVNYHACYCNKHSM